MHNHPNGRLRARTAGNMVCNRILCRQMYSANDHKVHSSTAGYRKVQHKEFGKYDSLLDILFPVHILGGCAQCWPTIQAVHAKEL